MQIINCLLRITFIGVACQCACAQHLAIDSLEHELKNESLHDTSRINLLNKLSSKYFSVDFNNSIAYAEEAKNLSGKNNYLIGQHNALKNLLTVYRHKGDLRKTLPLLKDALARAEEIQQPKILAETYFLLGNGYDNLGYKGQAFEALLKALSIYRSIGDETGQCSALMNLGIVNEDSDPETSMQFYNEALKLSKSEFVLMNLNMDIGSLLQKRKLFNESIIYLDRALRVAEKESNGQTVWFILFTIGNHYYFTEESDRAESYYRRALHVAENIENVDAQSTCLQGLAKISEKRGDHEETIKYLLSALAIDVPNKKYSSQQSIYRSLVEVYLKTSKFKDAYATQKKLGIVTDSLAVVRENDKLEKLRIIQEAVRNDLKISNLQKEQEMTTHILWLLISFIILAGILFSLFFYRKRKKIKEQERILNAEKATLELDLQMRQIKEETLKRELEFRNRELTTYTLNLLQKNEILEDLQKSIEQLKLESAEDDANIKLDNLLSKVNSSRAQQNRDWEHFQNYFQKVHEGFFDNLKATYPELNATELRLCALIKLNLETNQIASVMDLTRDGTKVARHRLRKKLKIGSDVNLETFFNTRT